MTWTPTRRAALRAGASVAVLASGVLLLGACSSSTQKTSSSSVSAGASGSGSASGGAQDMTAYRDCLSQHGVDMPSFAGRPSGGASGRPSGRPSGGGGFPGGGGGLGGASADPATQKALDACASLRPQRGGAGTGGAGSTAFAAFTSCLKDHGVVLPSASPGASGAAGRGGPGAIDTSDPKTAAAYDTCKALLPTGGPGASPSAT